MRRIPKSFCLLGHTITVRVVNKRDWDDLCEKYEELEDSVGWWIPEDDLIVIKRQSSAMMIHTLMHEITHAILYFMNSSLTHDEKFVDVFGGLLAQALSTAK